MKVVTKVTLSNQHMPPLRKIAQTRSTSVSAVIESAVTPYLAGKKKLPKMPKAGNVATGFTMEADMIEAFKTLAEQHNMSWNEAVRYAVENLVNELGA